MKSKLGLLVYLSVYLAFDYTFPPQAEGNVISKLGLLVYFSYQIKVRLHFSTAGRGKSDIEVRLVGLFVRIYLAFDYTFPLQAEGKVISTVMEKCNRTLNIYEMSVFPLPVMEKCNRTLNIYEEMSLIRKTT